MELESERSEARRIRRLRIAARTSAPIATNAGGWWNSPKPIRGTQVPRLKFFSGNQKIVIQNHVITEHSMKPALIISDMLEDFIRQDGPLP
ncbi:hypothetical cytosolic protein [Syntrophus aciditrophicus SB]|uniref:Hypothetical cytosolic protein n=1 Tax=Syntrophus aciditrophicus (strain SB) TaxID=56780 RepID=Q2LWD0_SYNAS|nr:hypothetical cytosolic protein [Syntrophus aciditrophicus SB]